MNDQNGGASAVYSILQKFIGWMAGLLAIGLVALVASHINLMMQVAELRRTQAYDQLQVQRELSRITARIDVTNDLLVKLGEQPPGTWAKRGRSTTAP